MGAGAGEKSRTPDLRITNALLYQLSYTGVKPAIIRGRGAVPSRVGLQVATPPRAMRHAQV